MEDIPQIKNTDNNISRIQLPDGEIVNIKDAFLKECMDILLGRKTIQPDENEDDNNIG